MNSPIALMVLSAFLSIAQAEELVEIREPLNLNIPITTDLQDSTDFQPWSELLEKYVNEKGLIHYDRWISSPLDRAKLVHMLDSACHQNPASLQSAAAEKVFWINTYNILSTEIKLRELEGFILPANPWKNVLIHVADKLYSLDSIENAQLRSQKDARIHFALHCHSKSCPVLQPKAWEQSTIQVGLDAAARQFLASDQGVSWNESTQTIHLSRIFEWYRSDFGNSDSQLIEFLSPYFTPALRAEIANLDKSQIHIHFTNYDWSLPKAQEDDGIHPNSADLIANNEPTTTTFSDHFPGEVEYWIKRRGEYDLGIREALELRKLLLQGAAPGNGITADMIHLDLVAIAVGVLQKQISKMENIVSISAFDVTREKLFRQITGEESLSAKSVFQPFSGKWYGLWDKTAVNHDWRPTRIPAKPEYSTETNTYLCADQYAWIHNGFGWNYLMSHDPAGTRNYILGQVYYLDDKNLTHIAGRKPHVGFVDIKPSDPHPTRLIWITEYEIFMEEAFPSSPDSAEDDYYVITAIYHHLFSESHSISKVITQAKYTRKNQMRPAFIHIPWNPPASFSQK
ncbi:MAG: DUF547 domain-containing protein [Verrucomicrobia bacterium]|nr:DUF547 domain-containing protein [Verrucomicrobiota bacterium]